jgi:hypothetical protein
MQIPARLLPRRSITAPCWSWPRKARLGRLKYRWGGDHENLLTVLATDLVQRNAALIAYGSPDPDAEVSRDIRTGPLGGHQRDPKAAEGPASRSRFSSAAMKGIGCSARKALVDPKLTICPRARVQALIDPLMHYSRAACTI